MIGVLRSMPKVKDDEIKKLSLPRGEFIYALKRVSRQVEKPKSSPKPSKT